MSQAVTTSGLVRVTVVSGTRRADLVLPGVVPVAELVPELARSVGLLDAASVHGGYTLRTGAGRPVAHDVGLTTQGVEDGGVLVVLAGVDEDLPRVYDDVVEAMTDIVEEGLVGWDPAAGRRTALGAAGLLLVLGASACLALRGSALATSAAAVASAALLASAVVLSRVHHEPEAAVVVGWTACLYAAVAGVLLAPAGSFADLVAVSSHAAPLAGLGALLAGGVAVVALGAGRALMLPPVVVGAVLALTGLVVDLGGADPRVVLCIALSLVVLGGSIFPWLALGLTRTSVDQLTGTADLTASSDDPVDSVDAAGIGLDAQLGHEVLVAIAAAVGLLLVLVAPLAVSLGLVGAALVVVCSVVVMLRTRQHRTEAQVRVGLVSGVVGLGSVAASALLLHPSWRPTAAVVLAASGAVLLALTLLPAVPSLRRGRFGDVAESFGLVAVLPLVAVASGAVSAVLGR